MSRPRLEIPADNLDYWLEALSILGVIISVAYPLFAYNSLPESIPSHINAAGKVDAYAGKITIWTLPAIAVLLYISLTLINKYPHHFNYPVKVTAENATHQYALAMRLNRMVKAVSCVFFGLFSYQFVHLAKSGETYMGIGSVVFYIIALFGVIGYFWWVSSSKKK